MALPVIANVYRVAFEWSHDDYLGHATNVMHFRKAASTASALFTSLDANVTHGMWQMQDTHAHINQVAITPLSAGGAATQTFLTAGSEWSGPTTSHDMSPQTCAIVKLNTALRGRSYRGRVYLPWVCDIYNTNGALDGGAVSNAQTEWDEFFTDMTADGFALVVASYKHATAENVTTLIVESRTATQRKRQIR
jgi:hypothetical protein